jgi:hypothetical protein
MSELTGRGIAIIGLVLTVVAIFIDAVGGESYWDDGTQGALLLILAAIAGLLLAASWVQNRPRPARAALGVCFMLLGYYLWVPALGAFDNWDVLDAGAWLALGGAVVAVAGAWIGSRSLGSEPVAASAMGARGVQTGTVVTLAGVVLCVISIWLDVTSELDISYWGLSEDHMLGVVMLIVGVACGLAALATWMGRGQAPALWTSLFALMLLGLFLFLPVTQAFGDLGELGIGAWLGFAGGLVAFAGAELAHTSTATSVRMTAPAPEPSGP